MLPPSLLRVCPSTQQNKTPPARTRPDKATAPPQAAARTTHRTEPASHATPVATNLIRRSTRYPPAR